MVVKFHKEKLLFLIFLCINSNYSWVFHSVNTHNNRLLGEIDKHGENYPVPYKGKNDLGEIDEDDPPDPPRETIILTWPGTKWCGPGNIAFDYHDLGYYNQTDKCCRAHDLCSDIIPAGHAAHGLQNDDFYTKLNCNCDDRFFNCLKKSTDDAGDTIGILYFNAIGTQCFKFEFPVVKCLEYRGILRKKCLKYEFDKNKPKFYQWFDVQPY